MDDYYVDCRRDGELISTFIFSVPHSIAAPGMAPVTELIDEAKAGLTNFGLAKPPYDDIKFSIRRA
jgi:hypothetical protein